MKKINFTNKIFLFFSTLQMIFTENMGLLSKREENQNKWTGIQVSNIFGSHTEELKINSRAQVI